MLVTERKLRLYIRKAILEQQSLPVGPDGESPGKDYVQGSREENLAKFGGSTSASSNQKDEVNKKFKKMKEIIDRNYAYAKDFYTRKLYSNDMSDKIREKISSLLPEEIKLITGMYTKEEILEYIVPNSRSQRYKNITDKNDPYYLNGLPVVIKKIKEHFEETKISMDIDNTKMKDFFSKKEKQGMQIAGVHMGKKKGIGINTANFEKQCLGKNEYLQKIRAALGVISFDDVDGWKSFENAVLGTIMHEMSHAFDSATTTGGRDTVINLARRVLKRYDNVFPDTRNKDLTARNPTYTSGHVYKQLPSKGSMGSQSFKNALKPVIKEKHHGCLSDMPESDESSLVPKEEGMPADYGVSRCQYLNIHDDSGQSEVRTRISQIKSQVGGLTIGVGKFKAEHIRYLRDNPGKARYDVRQLISMLREDSTDQEIADAFNKAVPSG